MEQMVLGKNIEDVQRTNQASILQIIRQPGETISRRQVSDLVGLTPGTVTNIVRDLMDAGYVMETGFLSGKKGRRAVGLALNPDGFVVLGVRLSRAAIVCRLFNAKAEVLYSKSVQIQDFEQADQVLEEMLSLMEATISESGVGLKLQAIGVSTPGPLNLKEGKIAYLHGNTHWRDVPIQQIVYDRFKVRTIMEHDANAAALAESLFSPSGETPSLFYVAAGRGIGAGIVLDGKLHHGSQGTAGLLGHVSVDVYGPPCDCGSRGCLTNYASSKAFLRRMQDLGYGKDKTMEFFAELVQKGEPIICQEVEQAAFYTGATAAGVVNVLNPARVVFGDEMTLLGSLWFEKAKEALLTRLAPEVAKNVDVRLSKFGPDAFVLGTAAIALEYVFQNPLLGDKPKELNQ